MKFRSPGYADYAFAGHQTRDRLLRTFAQREVLVANILGETPRDRLLLRVTDPRLGQWGKDDAVIAWKGAMIFLYSVLICSIDFNVVLQLREKHIHQKSGVHTKGAPFHFL